MGKSFDPKKLEMISKLAVNRLNIYKQKATDASLNHKKNIAKLIAEGKMDQARIMTSSVIAEDYQIEVFNIIDAYIHTLISRMDILSAAKRCPDVLEEACCSIIFAAPYISNDSKFGQPELLKVRKTLLAKFGKKFPAQCQEKNCLNARLMNRLTSKNPPDEGQINFYLKAISGKHDLMPLVLLSAMDAGEMAEPVNLEPLGELKPTTQKLHSSTPLANGVLVIDQQRNAWVIDDTSIEMKPVYIAPTDLNGAENGDRVVAELVPRSDNKLVGKIKSVAFKAGPAKVFEAELREDDSGNTVVEDPDSKKPVFIAAHELGGAEKGDIVRVELHPVWRKGSPLAGKVINLVEKAPKEFAGTIIVDAKGNHFVQGTDPSQKPIFVPAKDLNSALKGDVVTAICAARTADGKQSAKVLKIFKRAAQPREIKAKFVVDAKGNHWVKDPDAEKPIFIPPTDIADAKNGDVVLCRANPARADGKVVGKVLSVLEKAPEPREITGILERDANGVHVVRAQRATALSSDDASGTQLKAFEAKSGAVIIRDKDLHGAADGDIVQILAMPPDDDGTSYGKVLDVVAQGAFRGGRAGMAKGGSKFNPDKPAIVIDNGSGLVKAGFAGDSAPKCVFQSVTGAPVLAQAAMGGAGGKRGKFVGSQALAKRGMLQLSYPMDHGVCKNWDDMEAIWAHTFDNELRVDPTDRGVLLTEAPRNPRSNRERMAEIMFETFHVPALYVSIQAVLALYSSGLTTGLVVESGDGVTHVVPIFEGYSLDHAIQRVNLAGRDVSDYFASLLTEHGSVMTTSSEREIVRELKEQACYVSMDFAGDMQKSEREFEKKYPLPDGRSVTAGTERFRAPEVLFQPSFLGMDMGGLQHLIYKSVMSCDLDLRRPLWNNLVLGGGNTMFQNFDSRLLKELNTLVTDPGTKVEIKKTPHRLHSVWHGGSIVADLDTFRQRWATRENYEEYGASCMHRLAV